ncbi:DUF433 domain-containing protein [Thiocapsa sp.]|uniref:DUF433 domain-containing protein n=1 Tax=Thiocapsa sp. TaxID=2024551 RepID=UPI002C6DFEBD|nr:DUF433 domain-containing protein [Thiocapsa sp.]HSO82537.1 DUF433 domain-containing protein [Thiocapsa sp.]
MGKRPPITRRVNENPVAGHRRYRSVRSTLRVLIKEAIMTDWKDRIVCDPDTLLGKPRIRGTRIGVGFVLDRLADGWSAAEILDSYPLVTPDDLQAVFAFACDCVRKETLVEQAAAEFGRTSN